MAETDNLGNAPLPAEASAAAKGVLSGNALAPAAPPPPAANSEHSRVGGIFHAVLGTLSGGQREPAMDASGNVTEQPVHRAGGEWARRLLAGALTGMASGAAAPVRPGAGAAAGIGAGFAGEREALATQDAEKRGQLQQNFENQRQKGRDEREANTAADEGLLRKAQVGTLTQENAVAGFGLARLKVEASKQSIDAFNTFQDLVAADPANRDLGVFPDADSLVAYQKVHPEFVQQIAGGHDSGHIHGIASYDENGVYNGVHGVLVHPSQNDRTLAEVFPNPDDRPVWQYPVPGKMVNGKPGPNEWRTHSFDPSMKVGDAMAATLASASAAAKEKLQATQITHTQAETAEAGARTKQIAEGGNKPPAQETEFDKKTAESAAKDVEAARGGDFRFRSMAGSYPLALKGDQQAMMNILTNHIGMTMGMQKGARITKDILREAQESAPWLQRVEARFDKQGVLSGVTLTKEQMQQMMTLSTTQRANAWAQAVESARQGGVANKVQIPSDVRIRVVGPDGAPGTIPGSQLSAAEDKGYKVAPQ